MAVPERNRRAGFSLRLEHGSGRLVLGRRRIADLFTVDAFELSLAPIPSRLDMSSGVERFRHQRCRLDRFVVEVEDRDVGMGLRANLTGGPLQDIEVRAVDGDLVILGSVIGPPVAPFIARARIEPASVARERALLISFYDLRIFGPASISAPELSRYLLSGLGLSKELHGPSAAVIDPLDRLLIEACAELGWKLPDREVTQIHEVRCEAGQLRLVAVRRRAPGVGPRGLVERAVEGDVRLRRFLADYEAKTLYAQIEGLIAEGRLERAINAYERQLGVHPDHPFLITRLLQLSVIAPETAPEAISLARLRLQKYPDDANALTALAVIHWQRKEGAQATEMLQRIGAVAERRKDVLEAAQVACAIASLNHHTNPVVAINALEDALGLRRRLPGALRALADLHLRRGDWAATLRTRERLLASEIDPTARKALLLELGSLALDEAGDLEQACTYFERALEIDADDVAALLGVADAHEAAGRVLPAVRTLDRAVQVLQHRGDVAGAADAMVRLGDLWHRLPDGGSATAALRYRQSLLLVPGHAGALLGLAESAALDGEHGRARDHLEELLRQTAEGGSSAIDRMEVFLRLARLLAGPLGDAKLAVTYFQKALSGTEAQVEQALEALERLHTDGERWGDLARVLELAADRTSDRSRRAGRLLRQAQVLRERLEDPKRAQALLTKAVELSPHNPEVLDALAEVHRELMAWGKLAALLALAAEQATDTHRLAALYAERGELLRMHLNRADDAAEAYALALGCDSKHRAALEGLIDIDRERERYAELAELLERLAEVETSVDRVTLLRLELGRLLAGLLNRPAAAIGIYRQVLIAEPDETEALRRLGDLHFDGGRWAEALAMYQRLHTVYEAEGYDEPGGPFLLRVAETEQQLGNLDEALERLQHASKLEPNSIEIYEAAQDIMLRAGDVGAIVKFLKAGLARASRPTTRRFLAGRAGRLVWRELRRPEEAAELLDEVLHLDPDDSSARRVRLEVATALADWPRVADLLRDELARASKRERPGLLTRLAKLAFSELDNPVEGMQLILAAVDDNESYGPALELLGEQAFAQQDWPNVRRAYGQLVDQDLTHASIEDRYRLGIAELETGSAKQASHRLRQLNDEGVQILELLPTLSRAYLEAQDADGLAAIFDACLALFEPGEQRQQFQREAGRLFVDSPAHHERSVSCWQAVLAANPQDAEALAQLRRPSDSMAEMPSLSGRFNDDSMPPLGSEPGMSLPDAMADAAELEAIAANAEGAEERAKAWLVIAEHRRDRMHDPDSAIIAFEVVLTHAEPGEITWIEAIEALEDLHAIHGDWDALLKLYAHRRESGVGDPAEILLLEASIFRAAGRLDDAIEAARQAAPAGERAFELEIELLDAAGRSSEGASRLLERTTEASALEAAQYRRRAADRLVSSDVARALALYEAAADLLADDSPFVERWLEVARGHGTPGALGAALEAHAGLFNLIGANAFRRSRGLTEAAGLAVEAEAWSTARRRYEAAIDAWPDNIDALEGLTQVLEHQNDRPALADVLQRQIAVSLPGIHRGRLAVRALSALGHGEQAVQSTLFAMAREDLKGTDEAGLLDGLDTDLEPDETQSGTLDAEPLSVNEISLRLRGIEASLPPAEFTMLRDVLELEVERPDASARVFETLIRLYSQQRDYEALADTLGRHADRAASGAVKAALWTRQAEVSRLYLGDATGAVTAYLRTLTEREASPEATSEAVIALIELARSLDDLEMIGEGLGERLSTDPPPVLSATLLALRGHLRCTELDDQEQGITDLKQALVADPSNALAHLGLSVIATQRGWTSTAVDHLESALFEGFEQVLLPVYVEQAQTVFDQLIGAGAVGSEERGQLQAGLVKILAARKKPTAFTRRLAEGMLAAALEAKEEPLRALLELLDR